LYQGRTVTKTSHLPIRYFLALLWAHPILHISTIRVNLASPVLDNITVYFISSFYELNTPVFKRIPRYKTFWNPQGPFSVWSRSVPEGKQCVKGHTVRNYDAWNSTTSCSDVKRRCTSTAVCLFTQAMHLVPLLLWGTIRDPRATMQRADGDIWVSLQDVSSSRQQIPL